MRAWILDSAWGLQNLALRDQERPALGPNDVRLKMKAASLNFRDLLMVKGKYNPRQPLPLIPLSDGVGEVVEVGGRVSRVKVGDRVCPIFAQQWFAGTPSKRALRSTLGGPVDGTLAEERVFSEEGVVLVPGHLTDEQAATLPCAALTAWSALFTMGGLKPGESVLVQGTGGVSIFALQFARMMGARVIATSSSDEKLERAKALGARQTINYRDVENWGQAARVFAGGDGVDHVIEVGGAGTLEQSIRATRPGGTISLIGILAGGAGGVNLLPVLMQNIRMQGVIVGHRESFEAMNQAIAAHKMVPEVDRTFAFEDAAAAFTYLESAKHVGKVCIRIAD